MSARPWVIVALRETIVDDVGNVRFLLETHEEVVRLYVPVDKGLLVNVFESVHQLHYKHNGCLEGELPATKVK